LSTSKDKVSLEWEDYGGCLHAALRKCCDSEWTSVAWNVVHLMKESWEDYLKHLAQQKVTEWGRLKTESLAWERNHLPTDWSDHYARQTFCIALKNFDDNEWKAYAGFLGE
jgi:hypothetical protein